MKKNSISLANGLCLLFALVMLGLVFLANGTGDDGDSVNHYLYAHYAFKHPRLLLDHWGKPVFTLLAAPFAYWGFAGIKIFNVLLASLTMWLTYQATRRFNIPNAWVVLLLLGTSPMYITLSLSGLTEPLLGCALLLSLYLSLRGAWAWAAVLMSFTPLMRSEGIIMLGVFAIYLLVKRRYICLPLLLVGQAIYCVVGYPYYGDWLWVLHRIPYATLSSGYGAGELFHFVKHLNEVVSHLGVFWLFVGLLVGFGRVIAYIARRTPFQAEECWLVYGGFVAFFVAHSLFWYFGIFVSAGLTRVLLSVIPLMAIISLRGINSVVARLPLGNANLRYATLLFLVAATMIVSLSYLKWERDFMLNPAQQALQQAAKWIGDRYDKEQKTFYDAVYSSIAFDIDNFEDRLSMRQTQVGGYIEDKSLLIWDDFYARTEGISDLEQLKQDKRFTLLRCFEQGSKYSYTRQVCLFEKNVTPDSLKNILRYNDFESAQPNVDTLYAHQGKQSLRLKNPDAFSPGIEPALAALPSDCRAIRVTAWAYQAARSATDAAKLVITYDNFGQSIQWHDQPLNELALNTWQQVAFEVPMLRKIPPNIDRVKVFVWNPNDQPIWIDDFKVEIVR